VYLSNQEDVAIHPTTGYIAFLIEFVHFIQERKYGYLCTWRFEEDEQSNITFEFIAFIAFLHFK
jgi:hypothetical protein